MSSNNGPISVSAPGTSLVGAVGKDLTFNTRSPFAKLDSTNPVSFEEVNIFFGVDPPNPTISSTWQTTHLYSAPHGYKYTPTIWAIFNRVGAGVQSSPGDTSISPYAYMNDVICVYSKADNAASATLNVYADATNIYIDVSKFSGVGSVDLTGYTVTVRIYVFVEDLLGGGVPALP